MRLLLLMLSKLRPERAADPAAAVAVSAYLHGSGRLGNRHILSPRGFRPFFSAPRLQGRPLGHGCLHSTSRCKSSGSSRSRTLPQLQAAYSQASQGYGASVSSSSSGRAGLTGEQVKMYSLLRALLLKDHNIELQDRALLSGWQRVPCPSCEGGSSGEDSFGVVVNPDFSASWRCHRATCGFTGSLHLSTYLRDFERRQQRQQQQQQQPASGSGSSSSSSSTSTSNDGTSPAASYSGSNDVHTVPAGRGGPGAAQRQQQQQQGMQQDAEALQLLEQAMASGQLSASARRKPPVRPTPSLQPLEQHPQLVSWFADRCIGQAALEQAGARVEMVMGQPVVAFPLYMDGQLVNVAYLDTARCTSSHELLAPPGASWQVEGAVPVLMGHDRAAEELSSAHSDGTLVLALGELELLACYQAGVFNVVALPSSSLHQLTQQQQPGSTAPSPAAGRSPAAAAAGPGPGPGPGPGSQFAALDSCEALLELSPRVVLAAPNSPAGFSLGEELARRIGKERCYRVRWPSSTQDNPRLLSELEQQVEQQQVQGQQQQEQAAAAAAEDGPAAAAPASGAAQQQLDGQQQQQQLQLLAHPQQPDPGFRLNALETLAYDGPETLQYLLDAQAVEYPVQGLHSFADFWGEVYEYYMQQRPYETGVSSGWHALDQYYRVVPGELSIVTGVPNSGKSEWLDALLVNLSSDNNWSFALCSFEKSVTHHARQLLEKRYRRPFWPQQDQGLSRGEVLAGLDWLSQRFHLIRFDDDRMPSIDDILDKARIAVLRYGIRGLVIDPYNELSHERPSHMSETEFVSQMLSKVKRFAQLYECHVWFVAHPRQLHDWQNRAPNLYDISGSAHFINKADNGIVVHRDWEGGAADVQILVRKVRNKAAGRVGDCVLQYDRLAGVYSEPQALPG